jgi:heme/copper-type cytochrome/quinol oxidase subunit 3
MKKLIFLTFVLVLAIAGARLTINWMLEDKETLAAGSLLVTILFGSFFVQEAMALERNIKEGAKK